jgi:hypothetical protein
MTPNVCDTPGCGRPVTDARRTSERSSTFCDRCRAHHSYRVLITQAEHQKDIKDIIIDSAMFKNAGGMADYIGVSFVTLYHWIRKYFGCSFQEFKRQHICKSRECYLLDIRRSSYSRHDYVLKRLRQKRYCACINALEPAHIMTNAPVSVVQAVLRGKPKIEKISDKAFAIVPEPVHGVEKPDPVYFDLHDGDQRGSKKRKRKEKKVNKDKKVIKKAEKKTAAPKAPREIKAPVEPLEPLYPESVSTFRDRLLVTLHKLGGSCKVETLVRHLRTSEGAVPRKNNTRREVYRNSNLFGFDRSDSSKRTLRLLAAGTKEAQKILDAITPPPAPPA